MARIFVLIAIIAATPFCFIPAKDTYFQLLNLESVSEKQNRLVSFILVLTTYMLSVSIPNIKDAITLTGATVNPFIGFIFPIIFYIRLDPAPISSF